MTDYCKNIGLALASEDIDSEDERIISHLEDIKESIESHFNISFSSDFYYHVLKGYLRRMGTEDFYDSDEIAFELMARAIMYERDVDALAIKSQLLNSDGFLDEYSIEKDDCVFFLLSLIYRQMSKTYTEGQKAKIRNGWKEAELYSQNNQKWKSLMVEDYSSFDNYDLKLLADNIEQFIIFDDEENETESGEKGEEKEIDLKKYEHIEEEEPSLKQKLTKKRVFTQYIVIDGTFYSRSIELSRKEYDGNLEKKSDLERLKALFEEEYEDTVVGAESCYNKYTPEEARNCFDEDYGTNSDDVKIDGELQDFFNDCIDFTNILESKMH